jgi:hypothetical protein
MRMSTAVSGLALLLVLIAASGLPANAQATAKITTPKEAFGFNIGDDYQLATYTQLTAYWKKLASQSDRMKLVDIGPTAEGRRQLMAIITSPANQKNLAHYQEISRKLSLAERVSEEQARQLAHEGKAVVYIEGGLHAGETVGSQQEIQFVYEMLSRTDAETMRFLNDDIVLAVLANPDGQEIVADWYMREQDPLKRTQNGVPRLWHKYVGHDDNRDSFMQNMPETTNINRVLFREWHPQIFYDHHQAGPTGTVVFIPPFRDPFNYNLDPLVPLEIEQIGTALHTRLVSEDKGGSGMRTFANYSTWYNGAFRTNVYFHNMIGILSEIIGNPTPEIIPLVLSKQLPSGDWPLPVVPQTWHFKQSIDYEMTNNRAMLDYASRNRENMLYYRYRMGMNSIERGSKDSWTITPKRIEAASAAAKAKGGAVSVNSPAGGLERAQIVPTDLYTSVLHDPEHRDPRGYIIPANQDDYPTAVKFVNALLKNGVVVMKADRQFEVAGKSYPAGSFVVKTAQAFRPEVMDMFEPQDHPNDFSYPGGPPKPPYDITGWTLAYQMGVKFDRLVDGFDGPFKKIDDLAAPEPGSIVGVSNPAGFLVSHRVNDSFVLINRLLKANCEVYWLKKSKSADGQDLGTGTIWVPASGSAKSVLEKGAKEFGLTVHAVAKIPSGETALKLKPIRIGLYDQYGGLMPSGWLRWLFEQYEFPFEVVYPQTIEKGNLRARFDVLLFPDGAYRRGTGGRGGGVAQKLPDDIPAEYAGWTGSITDAKSIPQIKQFVESGGSVLTVGSSTSMASLLGVPVTDYLTEKGPDGNDRHLPQEKFYVPGSLLKANIDTSNPLAYGMPDKVDMVFDSSPVFKLEPAAQLKHAAPVAWFSGQNMLDSGWAWNPQYLDGATAVVEASVGEGKVMLFGPEVTFRGQPHATFKLLFNGLYAGSAQDTPVP